MNLEVMRALRDRLATSRRVVKALEGIADDSELLVPASDRVRIGEASPPIQSGTLALLPLTATRDSENTRTDAVVEIVIYGCSVSEVLTIQGAVGREINGPSKGCLTTAAPVEVEQLKIDTTGPIVREQGESRLYRCAGQIDVTYFGD